MKNEMFDQSLVKQELCGTVPWSLRKPSENF